MQATLLLPALAVAVLLATCANASGPEDVRPGAPMQSCATSKIGGGDDQVLRLIGDCRPMQSLNVARKIMLGAPFQYGDQGRSMTGAGLVIGWDGGAEGGPLYLHDDRG